MKLAFATYNILHGYHSDMILKNLTFIIEKGANVICIQEADYSFKDLLDNFINNKKWKVIYFHTTKACNLAIAYNPYFLTLKTTENIFLPTLNKPSLVQRTIDLNERLQRGAFSASFLMDTKVVRITNAHLAWEGGIKHTLNQLLYIKKKLDKQSFDYEILAGDFNTFIPLIFKRIKEKKVEQVLIGWYNALPKISWTCDVSCTAPQDGITPYAKLLSSVGIKMRSRLDYIFIRKMKVVSGEMLDLSGSDHRPIVATFEI